MSGAPQGVFRWPRRKRVPRLLRLPVAAAGVVPALLALVWGLVGGASQSIVAGDCESVASCASQEREAAARVSACAWFCGAETERHRSALRRLYRAQERAALQAHYERRAAIEQAQLEERRAAGRRERLEERRAEAARAERDHRHELERQRLSLELQQRLEREQREQLAAYVALLGEDGRRQRLRRCHERESRCEPLLAALLAVASGPDERRTLAQLHERLLAGEPLVAARVAADAPREEMRSVAAPEGAQEAL